ncbi:lebercilin-like protein [Rhinatrema bivittatum]|uniref:lebercilin-like protein n=1 Tax=Rhinatrema bivittatum TaxID=194408 RepID=UPI00112871C9|nr:lebercilin-like protein [Rhinatrema bivittatum]XP_029434115.1 lebercilin-like protein [Rhinatrema bivittatum]XP_029434116.1 lebercilin-like protein [Rhinatrema bivittatum]XP_029434117.1 lebercilin-like protein [Rhinatrema bivittatum]XP_029434118.1 lebercilin-like protein [Rhinatrema bivittatum]
MSMTNTSNISLGRSLICMEVQEDNTSSNILEKRESEDYSRNSSDIRSGGDCSVGTQEERNCSSASGSKGSSPAPSDEYSNEDILELSSASTFIGEPEITKKTVQEKKNVYSFKAKGNRTRVWKKSHAWRTTLLNLHSLSLTQINMKNDVPHRILSARLHKIKELKNELYEMQCKVEAASLENKILKRIQQRHIKALGEFENTENGWHQLITKHHGEVKMLRRLFRKSQEEERSTSRKLKEVESELCTTKHAMQKLQKISEDKKLAERGELTEKLSLCTVQLEVSENQIKGLEKQLKLNNSCSSRQLTAETRKTVEAQETKKKLQLEINLLQQKIKEKERELGIKNIYANRMQKHLQKEKLSPQHKEGGLTKAVQTENLMFIQDPKQDALDIHTEEKMKEEINFEAAKEGSKEDDYRELIEEIPLMEEHFELLERQRKRREEQERQVELVREELERLMKEDESQAEEDVQGGKNQGEQAVVDEREKVMEESCDKTRGRQFSSRLRRHYKFSEATENLHQGLPAIGPISNARSNKNTAKVPNDRVALGLENVSSGYEPSFAKKNKVPLGPEDTLEEKGRNTHASLIDRKSSLMEELFGPGYSLKSSFSASHTKGSEKIIDH